MKHDYQAVVAFHGHSCPGLAMGYRLTQVALEVLAAMRAEDEELVAVVENDACGVDALQCLAGCTFGKGNLIFRDYGKQVYTLYCRSSGQGVRVCLQNSVIPTQVRQDRQAFTAWLLDVPAEQIVRYQKVSGPPPPQAQRLPSVPCDLCGEAVMASRIIHHADQQLCIPCARQQGLTDCE